MLDSVHIGLGSNVGDRERNLLLAMQALSHVDAVSVVRHSGLFESAPIGPEQPRYLNAVVEVECDLPPERLLSILKQIELDLGRTDGPRWGPRTIDLDILLWGASIVAVPALQIPHLLLHQRRFALQPLCELVPEAVHPILKTSIRELLQRAPPQDVARHVGSAWPEVRP